MKAIKLLSLISLFFFLTACANNSMIPITEETLNEAGEVVKTTTKYVAETSTAKEESVHVTLRNRDRMIAQSNSKPSMELKWVTVEETVFYPGMTEPITIKRAMPSLTYTEKMQFTQQLPTKPSNHPMWTTINTLGGAAIQGTLIGYGINQIVGGFKSLAGVDSTPTTTINADNATFDESFNNPRLNNYADGTLTYSPGTAPAPEPILFSTDPTVPTDEILPLQ